MTGDKITMTFWRPQRAGIGSEPDFVDMEHLRYGIPVASDNRELGCGASRYTGLSPTRVPAPGASDGIYNQLFPLQDSADDRAPDAANAQAHLRHRWLHAGRRHRPSGQQIRLPIEAVDESRPGGTDRTAPTIAVCLPGCTPSAQQGPGPQQGASPPWAPPA